MRFVWTLACLSLLPLYASAQVVKEGPIADIKVLLKEPLTYEKHVEPIFYKRCTVCHSGNLKEGKLDILELRRAILANMPDTKSYFGQQAYWQSAVADRSKK